MTSAMLRNLAYLGPSVRPACCGHHTHHTRSVAEIGGLVRQFSSSILEGAAVAARPACVEPERDEAFCHK